VLASYGTSSSAQVSERRELSGTRDAAELPRRIKVSLVTSFPPSRGDLNEYGYHLACAMRDDPRVELSVLADDTDSQAELAGFRVQRCWRFDSVFNPVRLLMAIRKSEPDVVWFNIGFSTFARGPIAAFVALTVPAMTRILGCYTHITLHTVFERINLKDAGIRFPGLYQIAGRIATRLLLLSGDISVLLPSFQSEIINNYGVSADRVRARPHVLSIREIAGFAAEKLRTTSAVSSVDPSFTTITSASQDFASMKARIGCKVRGRRLASL